MEIRLVWRIAQYKAGGVEGRVGLMKDLRPYFKDNGKITDRFKYSHDFLKAETLKGQLGFTMEIQWERVDVEQIG